MGTSKAKTPLSNRRLKAVYPHIESLEDFFDIAQLTQDDLNIFGRQVSPAFSDISEISDDGDGQISLNPGLYVSPSLANRIAARKRDVCPPKCSLRSKKSVPREKQRISWCNPVVQDEQSPPEDPMICNGDAIATNPNYLHRARALSKSFFQPIRQCESTGWTSKRPSPRKQRVVLAILIGIIFMAVLAVAAIFTWSRMCPAAHVHPVLDGGTTSPCLVTICGICFAKGFTGRCSPGFPCLAAIADRVACKLWQRLIFGRTAGDRRL